MLVNQLLISPSISPSFKYQVAGFWVAYVISFADHDCKWKGWIQSGFRRYYVDHQPRPIKMYQN